MFTVTKRIEVAGQHRLRLPYKSKCSNWHGHNWIITVEAKCLYLNTSGMVIDFTSIKETVDQLDHASLNDFVEQPTAENIAEWIAGKLEDKIEINTFDRSRVEITKITVQESEGNTACYIP